MNCTAFGLMSAIPLLLLHARMTTTTGNIVNSLEMAAVKAVNTISTFSKRQFERSPILTGVNTVGADHVQTMA
jgi:biopolymer transport protein ExbB